jgi:predicted secreted acid phosphatase
MSGETPPKNICQCGILLIVLALLCDCSTQPGFIPTDSYRYKNLNFYKSALDAYVDSGDYEKDIARAIDPAINYLNTRADSELTKPANERQKLAIVLDIDETSVSNLPEIRTRERYGYNADDFNLWLLKARAPAIRPVLTLYQTARGRGVKVFFVTSRRTVDEIAPNRTSSAFVEQTLKNLIADGYKGIRQQDVFFRQPSQHDSYSRVSDYKSHQRLEIVRQGYHIILNVGDQASDLTDVGAANPTYERAVKIPNPFYSIP